MQRLWEGVAECVLLSADTSSWKHCLVLLVIYSQNNRDKEMAALGLHIRCQLMPAAVVASGLQSMALYCTLLECESSERKDPVLRHPLECNIVSHI